MKTIVIALFLILNFNVHASSFEEDYSACGSQPFIRSLGAGFTLEDAILISRKSALSQCDLKCKTSLPSRGTIIYCGIHMHEFQDSQYLLQVDFLCACPYLRDETSP